MYSSLSSFDIPFKVTAHPACRNNYRFGRGRLSNDRLNSQRLDGPAFALHKCDNLFRSEDFYHFPPIASLRPAL